LPSLTHFLRPSPPFLEVGAYFADGTDASNFRTVLNVLCRAGAVTTGMVGLWSESAGQFAGIHDRPIEHSLVEPSSVDTMLADPASRVAQVYLLVEGETAILTYLSISEEAASSDHHPIALWLSGEDVWEDMYGGDAAPERGDAARNLLLLLAEQTPLSYGALTVEYGLECPFDLAREGKSEAFCDFVLSTKSFAANELDEIQTICAGAHIERHSFGVYVSSTPVFNRSGTGLADGHERSCLVGEVVANTMRAAGP
jgi:hypothetical protein